MAPAPPRLEIRRATKRFAGIAAVQEVSLALGPGEVLAMVGENGAGKSTLAKLCAGVHALDEGEILLDGRAVEMASPRRARELGIALIHQELDLADNLDVGANLFLGREPTRFGIVDRRAIAERSREALARVGARFGPEVLLARLSIGDRQLVEIAKALALDVRVLLMDEPTSSLSAREVERLFVLVRSLAARGVSILYVSHRLGEIQALADRVVVLRDGRVSGELHEGEIDHDAIVRLMVGRAVSARPERDRERKEEVVLEARGVRVPAHPAQALDFSIHAGEIVGLAGLVGAGRSELLAALFGIASPLGGEIRFLGERLRVGSPRHAMRRGMALVPEDRKLQGLFLGMTVESNIGIASLTTRSRAGFVDPRAEQRLASDTVEKLAVRTRSIDSDVGSLSGGNQQKVILGRWLALAPRLLLLDEPTRGIDVGARGEIHALVRALADAGTAVLFASSEMEEILALADRVLVMHEGAISGELSRAELSEESVMGLATRSAAMKGNA
jgi:ribose transport system ATP-binding protein